MVREFVRLLGHYKADCEPGRTALQERTQHVWVCPMLTAESITHSGLSLLTGPRGNGAVTQQYSCNNTSSPRSCLLLPTFLTCSPAPFLAVTLCGPSAETTPQAGNRDLFSFSMLHWMLLVWGAESAQGGGRELLGWGEDSHSLPRRSKREQEKQVCLSSWLCLIIRVCAF